ncbi:MAG TPA: glycosyltransferase [Vineibacter sp.]|nr:glycosyltransferase [Vineibacter sp.]
MDDLRRQLRQRDEDVREALERHEQLRLELDARDAAHKKALQVAVRARETAIRDDFGLFLTELSFVRRSLRRGVLWAVNRVRRALGREPLGSLGDSSVARATSPHTLCRHVFDAGWYVSAYPDVLAGRGDPLLHFLSTGWRMRRNPGPLFDTAWYLARNPELAAAGVNPLLHFLRRGGAEGQSPSPLFDSAWYLRRYPDVATSGINPLVHYILHGVAENRDPCEWFDTDWYVAQNPDAGAPGVNPLAHYATVGGKAGQDPHLMFNSAWYIECHPEVAAKGITPLAHFLSGSDGTGLRPASPTIAYARRVLDDSQRLAVELPELLRHIDVMLYRPTFVVLVEGTESAARKRSLESLGRQIYDRWRVMERDASSTLDELVASQDAFMLWIAAGDVLDPKALYALACAVNADPEADLIYADEDRIDDAGRRSHPFHKPDWSPDTLESFNYVGPGACFRGALAAEVLRGSRSHYDFVLRFAERAQCVRHIRDVLCHRPDSATTLATSERTSADVEALCGRLRRTGRDGDITPIGAGIACYDVVPRLSARRRVSLIVTTDDDRSSAHGRDRVAWLESLTASSTPDDIELIVVAAATAPSPDLAGLVARRRGKLVHSESDRRGRPAMLNIGAAAASGDMLLFLADDLEPARVDWLERLRAPLAKTHVGAVGGKLVDPEGRSLHVGIASVKGRPVHVRRGYPRDDTGYFFSSRATRNVMAVTSDCLLTDADLFRHLGGFNEALSDGFHDVDYCLKVQEIGRTVVLVPAAEFTRTAPAGDALGAATPVPEYLQHRWARSMTSDRYYNEASLTNEPANYEPGYGERWI